MSTPYDVYLAEKARASRDELADLNELTRNRRSPQRNDNLGSSHAALTASRLDSTLRNRSPDPSPSRVPVLSSSTTGAGGAGFAASDYIKSIGSGGGSGEQPKSRAVISALKALQDKIRTLEHERDRYQDSLAMAEREKSSLQHVIESERQAEHEKIMMKERQLESERLQMESELRAREERLRTVAEELNATEQRARQVEHQKRQAELAAQQAELRASRIAQQAADEGVNTTTKIVALEREQAILKSETTARIQDLQRAIAEERARRENTEMSAQQAEQALRSVLDINESLLEKVTSHEVSPVRRPSKSSRRTKKKRAGRPKRRKRKTTGRKPPGATARRARERSRKASRRRSARGAGSASGSGLPFILGTSSGKSFSVHANVQQTLSMLQSRALPASASGDASRGYGGGGQGGADGLTEDVMDSEIDFVINSLEDEFASLTVDYQELVGELQSMSPRSRSASTADSAQLKNIVAALERKGDQITTLKRYAQNVRRRQSRMEREVDNLEDDLAAARANVGPPPSPLRILQGVRELQRSLIDD